MLHRIQKMPVCTRTLADLSALTWNSYRSFFRCLCTMESSVLTSVLVVLTCVVHVGRGEVFTALVEMEPALKAEAEIAKIIHNYISTEEQRLHKLKSIVDELAHHSAEALENPSRYLGNPVHAFLTVKRFSVDWDSHVTSLLKNDNEQTLLKTFDSFSESFPNQDDYYGAIEALLRLQDTYKLNTHKLAQGIIPGVDDLVPLSAGDCFEIGRKAYADDDHYHTLMWMQESLNKMEEEGTYSLSDKATVLDYLSYATYMQGNLYHARNLTLQWIALQPNQPRAINNLANFNHLIASQQNENTALPKDQPQNYRFYGNKDEYRNSYEFRNYEALCRGENIMPIPDAHKLTCQYRFWHPMFYISPLKEETMSFKPWLAFYHDVLTNAEIEKVKALATPRLQRATVHNPQTGKLEFAKYRISKSSWLSDGLDPVVAHISARCSAITNLTLDTVEDLQVVNYGIGGHYEPHFDFSRREEPTSFETARGNRILTLIFYMSDVEAGGATAFINAGLKVWPKKGTAAVWYNLFPSGAGDYSTRHAACPVLTGSKWVANKWFHERGQEFTRLCGKTPDSLDIFTN